MPQDEKLSRKQQLKRLAKCVESVVALHREEVKQSSKRLRANHVKLRRHQQAKGA